MSLSERSRSALYRGLSQAVQDEGAVEEMLSHFPARDVEEAVTKEHLRAEMAALRAEIQAEFGAVRSEVGGLRGEIQAEFGAVRSETGGLRGEMIEEFAAVRREATADIAGLRVELRDAMRSQTRWLVATMVSLSGAVVGVAALVA